MTKYGKVYVLERKTAEIISKTLLESVSFCNTTHKWYDTDGTLSPLYEKYRGRPISIQFQINQTEKNGKLFEFNGKLKLPYKLGEVAHQDFESVPKVHQEVLEWLKNIGTLSENRDENDEGHRIFEDLQGAALAAAFCPGWKISEVKALHLTVDTFFIFDSFIDQSAQQQEMPFKLAHPFWSALSAIMEGDSSKADRILTKIPGEYMKMVAGIKELWKEVSKKRESAAHLVQSYKDFNDALCLENCLEWKQHEENSTSELYKTLQPELRLFTCGASLTIELILFDQGVQLPSVIRESFVFKSIIRALCQQAGLVNDLMSLSKEMVHGTTSNKVFLFHDKDGLSLEDALEKSAKQINSWTQIVEDIGKLLVELYGEYEEAAKLVTIIKGVIYGNIQWHGITTRYHSNMIYDCVVELN